MDKGKVKDITVEILISIRDEIKGLREEVRHLRDDTNARFAEVDKRLERIEKDISGMKQDMKARVSYFERDYMLLAHYKMGVVEGRLRGHVQEAHN